jgi:hypothetical protein
MLRGGILITLGAIVGLLLIHLVMLANFLRRMPHGQLAAREFLVLLLTGGIGKDYMALLTESRITPVQFDKTLCILDKILGCLFIGGLLLAVAGFIVTFRS